ncbi:transglycosylase SLT domain-containing protein [Desulfomarina sp.]
MTLAIFCPTIGFSGQMFPHYPEIKKNIAFWKKIYSTYSLNDAVIHDSDNLSIIYEVIPLLDSELPGADRLNRLTRKQALSHYSRLLRKIAKKRRATSPREKKILALFRGPHKFRVMAKAADNVRIQTGQRERFLQGVIRAGAYMEEMKRIFRTMKLPEELAYIPHVESSFNTRAYSKFGAAGMWQFTRGTGRQYLAVNYTIDERLDPILSTKAAARYLKNSYLTLGNWPLAITSYNYGLAGMVRAVSAKGSYQKIFSGYDSGHFKFASKNFYSEFLAALEVAEKLEKTTRIRKKRYPPTRYLKLRGFIHIDRIRSHFHLSHARIKALNPALRPPIFTGEKFIPKGYPLRLPDTKNIRKAIASLPSAYFKKKQRRSSFHLVRRGDTAGSIARLHGISLKKLIKANNLDRYATIYIKQKLRIPQPGPPPLSEKKSRKKKKRKQVLTSDGPDSVPLLTAKKKNRPTARQNFTAPTNNS